MHEPDDVARSLRRYLGLLVPVGPPPDWTLRLERRNVSDDARPVGVVLLGDVTVLEARETFDQGNVVDQYPITIYMYPTVAEDAQIARREGDALRDLLRRWIVFGFALKEGPTELLDENDRPKAGPMRLPLWDWDGIPSAGPLEDREPPEHAHDAMVVTEDSLVVQNLEDKEDERRRAVVAEFRLQVEYPGRTDDRGGGVVTGVEGAFAGEP